MENREMFLEYMTALGEYHRTKVSKVLMDIYWTGLEPYTDEQCKKAFDLCFTEETYGFPKIPVMKKFMGVCEDYKTDEAKASIAWTEVDNAVRTVGNYASVQFSDPVIHSVIKAMGGWSTLCQCTNDEWKWKRVEFEKLYPTMAKRGGHDGYLIGDAEQSQRIRGSDDFDEPERVGFLRQQAQQLLKEENDK